VNLNGININIKANFLAAPPPSHPLLEYFLGASILALNAAQERGLRETTSIVCSVDMFY
jgi:hypothetical protein